MIILKAKGMRTPSSVDPATIISMVVMPPTRLMAVMAMIPSTDNRARTPSSVVMAMTTSMAGIPATSSKAAKV